jgi:hypothetical protein
VQAQHATRYSATEQRKRRRRRDARINIGVCFRQHVRPLHGGGAVALSHGVDKVGLNHRDDLSEDLPPSVDNVVVERQHFRWVNDVTRGHEVAPRRIPGGPSVCVCARADVSAYATFASAVTRSGQRRGKRSGQCGSTAFAGSDHTSGFQYGGSVHEQQTFSEM